MDKNLRNFVCVGVESTPCGVEFVAHHLRGKVGEPRCDRCREEHKAWARLFGSRVCTVCEISFRGRNNALMCPEHAAEASKSRRDVQVTCQVPGCSRLFFGDARRVRCDKCEAAWRGSEELTALRRQYSRTSKDRTFGRSRPGPNQFQCKGCDELFEGSLRFEYCEECANEQRLLLQRDRRALTGRTDAQ
jgi:hypothetical protein